jgi:ABC-type multidrug transport system fused ATPase/permease subunit
MHMRSDDGIVVLQFCDIFLYTFLAWYFSQVWYSKVGTPKPFYFPLMPSYWFGETTSSERQPSAAVTVDAEGLRIALVDSNDWKSKESADKPTVNALGGSLQQGESPSAYNLEEAVNITPNVPIEPAPEHIFGKPTVKLNRLRKSFGGQVAVNDLSLNMYENQIFALLGHNGAGKVSKRLVQVLSQSL